MRQLTESTILHFVRARHPANLCFVFCNHAPTHCGDHFAFRAFTPTGSKPNVVFCAGKLTFSCHHVCWRKAEFNRADHFAKHHSARHHQQMQQQHLHQGNNERNNNHRELLNWGDDDDGHKRHLFKIQTQKHLCLKWFLQRIVVFFHCKRKTNKQTKWRPANKKEKKKLLLNVRTSSRMWRRGCCWMQGHH